jgi:hypothetical protein
MFVYFVNQSSVINLFYSEKYCYIIIGVIQRVKKPNLICGPTTIDHHTLRIKKLNMLTLRIRRLNILALRIRTLIIMTLHNDTT